MTISSKVYIIRNEYFLLCKKTKGSFLRGLAAPDSSAVFLPLDCGHQRTCCLTGYLRDSWRDPSREEAVNEDETVAEERERERKTGNRILRMCTCINY
ncbi:hypothetical protein X777_09558 [Ooceraea biroi]|uniref:Uncharacterized protein n=1 Tax=Ooceraea biroi TaxID=2015173 RepID=A0A026W823_OOCBI|nr:hypothetical protein X777_09558 [Ooceraea biroi]